MIIDAHVHIFEEKMWPKRFLEGIYEHKKHVLSEEDFKHYKAEAKTETLIKEMDEARVDVAVCLPIDNAFLCYEEPEIPIWKANEYVAEAQAKYPDRIVGFFGCDPMRPDSVDMLEKGIRELGLRGGGSRCFPDGSTPMTRGLPHIIRKLRSWMFPCSFIRVRIQIRSS
jgi:predicted TIM-barrel fold metal-dependent hydrolase